jgi:hypothetical protein
MYRKVTGLLLTALAKEDERGRQGHQPIHELADTVGISYGVCQEILTENLNMRRTAAKFVPQLLTNDQKQRPICVSWALREG